MTEAAPGSVKPKPATPPGMQLPGSLFGPRWGFLLVKAQFNGSSRSCRTRFSRSPPRDPGECRQGEAAHRPLAGEAKGGPLCSSIAWRPCPPPEPLPRSGFFLENTHDPV